MTAPAETARLRIRRGGPDDPERLEDFEVPYEPGQSVLDGLRWIRANRDPSLAVRFSCLNANACKECVMRIDGRVGYACTARLEPGPMCLEPLKNKVLIRDLVTDVAPPGEKL